MEKNAAKFAGTGGWDFRAYAKGTGSNVVKNAASDCYGCHVSQKARLRLLGVCAVTAVGH